MNEYVGKRVCNSISIELDKRIPTSKLQMPCQAREQKYAPKLLLGKYNHAWQNLKKNKTWVKLHEMIS